VHRTQRPLAAAAALSLALLVSACGTSGGSDAGAKDDGKDTTTTEATSTTTSADDGAQARADSVDLEESDFPDGWTASPASADDEDSPMKACDPSFSDEDAKLAKHSTDDFTTGSLDDADGSVFSAETVVFADAATADAAVAVFDDEDVVACLDAAVKDTLGGGQDGVTVDGALQDDDVDLGTDNAAGVSATYQITADDGSSVNATVAILAFNTGDVGTMVTIVSLGDGLEPTAVRPPVQRLAELQGEA
jgi:hypothetical protein